MAMTMTQKILAAHAGLDQCGCRTSSSRADLDMVLGNDITTPVAVNEFEKAGFDGMFNREKIIAGNGPLHAEQGHQGGRTVYEMPYLSQRRFDVENFFDVGTDGDRACTAA